LLRERGALDRARHELIAALVAEHLKQHGGDPVASLEALGSSIEPVREGLSRIDDKDIQVGLSIVGRNRPDPDSTTPGGPAQRHAGQRYRIVRFHAEGGLGRVYEAHDGELGRKVAIKEIQPDKADLPHLRARFVLEAEISGGLQHPGIVPIYSLGSYAD